MRYMNDYDIAQARSRFGRGDTPNRLALALVIDNLAEWTNTHSDGWPYWTKPRRAADTAMGLIESRTSRENQEQESNDITDAEMRAAVKPIRAFLTREKVTPEWRERILRAVDAPTGTDTEEEAVHPEGRCPCTRSGNHTPPSDDGRCDACGALLVSED